MTERDPARRVIVSSSLDTSYDVAPRSSAAPALALVGLDSAPFQGIAFDAVSLNGQGAHGCTQVSGVTLTGSTIYGVTGSSINCP